MHNLPEFKVAPYKESRAGLNVLTNMLPLSDTRFAPFGTRSDVKGILLIIDLCDLRIATADDLCRTPGRTGPGK